MVTNQGVIETLHCILEERGWSVNRLAVEANMSQSTIQSIFGANQEYLPSLPTLNKICEALNLSVWEFLKMVEGEHQPLLSTEERHIVREVQKLSWKQKQKLLEFLEVMNEAL